MWKCAHLVTFIYIFTLVKGDDAIDNYPRLQQVITTQDIIAGDVFFEITDPSELEFTYRLRPAKDFGSSFSKRLDNVYLVPTQPANACISIINQKQMQGNVALIDRGECSFLTKTINVEKAGAQAAIITEINSESPEFDYYIEMIPDSTDERDAHIPAGFLLGRNGIAIQSALQRLKRTYAIMNIPVNLTFTPPSKINHPPWLGW